MLDDARWRYRKLRQRVLPSVIVDRWEQEATDGCTLCDSLGPCWCVTAGEAMEYRIRQMRPTEKDAVIAMDRECFPSDTREDFRRSKAVWWVVVHVESGELAGYAGGYPRNYRNENAFIVARCGVLPKHRGKGLQIRQLRVCIAHAKRTGRALVWSYTSNYNVVSSNNMIAAGFRLWAPSRWNGNDEPLKPSGGYAWLYWQRKV